MPCFHLWTTALDVTIQAQVLDLIVKLKKEKQTSMILITHDLGIVAEVCDKVAIISLFNGKGNAVYRVELSLGSFKIFFQSFHSQKLRHLKRLSPIPGLMPDPAALPKGCSFCPRCTCAGNRCEGENPEMTEVGILPVAFPGNSYQFQHLRCFDGRIRLGALFMNSDTLGNLTSHGHNRIQGGHGVLEDHGNLLAADGAHLLLIQLQQVLACGVRQSGADLQSYLPSVYKGTFWFHSGSGFPCAAP